MQSSIKKRDEATTGIGETIECRNVKGVLEELKIDEINLLKVDTEGCEIEIITEIFKYIEKPIGYVCFEYHSADDRVFLDRFLEQNYYLYHAQALFMHCGVCAYVHKSIAENNFFFQMGKIH